MVQTQSFPGSGARYVEFPWALEVTKNAPQQAIKNAGTAFSNFFRKVKAGKSSKDCGYPDSSSGSSRFYQWVGDS